MSIRIRDINGHKVALCAARTQAESGDHYLNDAEHSALMNKFIGDIKSMGIPLERLGDYDPVALDIEEAVCERCQFVPSACRCEDEASTKR